MTDYTPTTEVVRDAFCESYADHLSGFKREEFDRWLGVVKAQAVAEWLAERMAAFERVTLEDYEQGETE